MHCDASPADFNTGTPFANDIIPYKYLTNKSAGKIFSIARYNVPDRSLQWAEMKSAISVHDNLIYAYSVDCENRKLTLHTAFRDRVPHEYTDIVFQDVVAHHFANVLQANILFDVNEKPMPDLVRENESLLLQSWRYGWPPVTYNGDLDVLIESLQKASVRAYVVGSSYGLSGWILAGGCTQVSRDEAAQVA